MDKWTEAMIVRDMEGYKRRLKAFSSALENWYQDQVDDSDENNSRLEMLMLTSYELANFIRTHGDIIRYEPRTYGLQIGNAVKDVTEVLYSEAVKRPLSVEIQKLEGLSRCVYEYLRRTKKIPIKRTM